MNDSVYITSSPVSRVLQLLLPDLPNLPVPMEAFGIRSSGFYALALTARTSVVRSCSCKLVGGVVVGQ